MDVQPNFLQKNTTHPIPMAISQVMQDLQEARRRDSKKHRSWPTKMLQSFSCWAEDGDVMRVEIDWGADIADIADMF